MLQVKCDLVLLPYTIMSNNKLVIYLFLLVTSKINFLISLQIENIVRHVSVFSKQRIYVSQNKMLEIM